MNNSEIHGYAMEYDALLKIEYSFHIEMFEVVYGDKIKMLSYIDVYQLVKLALMIINNPDVCQVIRESDAWKKEVGASNEH